MEYNRRFILRIDLCICHGSLLLMNHEHQVATVTVNKIKVNVCSGMETLNLNWMMWESAAS